MNDTERPPRSIPDHALPRTRPDPKARPIPGAVADGTSGDGTSAADDAAWLDRLASALTAGLIVAAPRTALLVTTVLGDPVPRSASTETGHADELRTTGDRRTDA
jgi:hypothetical protein